MVQNIQTLLGQISLTIQCVPFLANNISKKV